MRIGMTELLLVFVVALFALGPERLPAYAKKLGEAVSQFKKYSDEATQAKPLEDLDKAVQGNVKDIKESFAGIGKQKPPAGGEKPEEEESREAAAAEDAAS